VAAASGVDGSQTITVGPTQAGVILGTAAYMPPEQARGLTVDKRADIWAFGCVIYEMLSGRRPFEGQTMADLLAAVMTTEPDWAALPAGSPVRTLQRCLEKDPKRRLRDIGDADLEPVARSRLRYC
jgi:serine/threonine protein kinase